MIIPPLALSLLDALDEPALIVGRQRTLAANPAAHTLLGTRLVGLDVRFAIRQPQALDLILARRPGKIDVLGIGGVERSWVVIVSQLSDELLLVRLTDRSAGAASERAQVNFVANASHELRTPLAAVLGYSETLAEPGALDEDVRRRFGQQIHDQAKRMLGIVRDLMSLSRIEADRFVEPRGRIALADIVAEATRAAATLADSRGCGIDLDSEREMPTIRGDAPQIRQVVDNLLHNALRYGCRSQGERVEVRLTRGNRWQQLSVRDHGEGIAAEHIPRLTERFYRVDSARSRDSGGTGLGLAIVKQVVERHRGVLDIRSQLGEGTEVIIRFPEE